MPSLSRLLSARLTLSAVVWAALCGACGVFSGEGDGGAEASGGPDLPAPDPVDVVMATFNTRLFFDTRCDSGQCGPGGFEELPSAAQFDARADQLAAAIQSFQADVVVLQEVETQTCLDALTDRLGDAYPTALLGETDYAASIDVAVLSRFPVLKTRRWGGSPLQRPSGGITYFTREFLEVHLDAGGHRVIVFAAHFKAKVDDDPERRLAEGTRAREIVDDVAAEYGDALIVLGGDLNDTPDSPALTALQADGGMLRVAEDIVPDDWTYLYNDRRDAIDHLLLATAANGGGYVPASALVFRGATGSGYAGSDHAALRARFRAGE